MSLGLIDLPHTAGCLVCGRDNPRGLKLDLQVDPSDGSVRTSFTPGPHDIGFTGIAHGGVLATVLDEAMVWAASWAGRRFCYCGELTVRFREPAIVGEPLDVHATVLQRRSRLITTAGTIKTANGSIVGEASAKYVPMPLDRHAAAVATFLQPASHGVAIARLTP